MRLSIAALLALFSVSALANGTNPTAYIDATPSSNIGSELNQLNVNVQAPPPPINTIPRDEVMSDTFSCSSACAGTQIGPIIDMTSVGGGELQVLRGGSADNITIQSSSAQVCSAAVTSDWNTPFASIFKNSANAYNLPSVSNGINAGVSGSSPTGFLFNKPAHCIRFFISAWGNADLVTIRYGLQKDPPVHTGVDYVISLPIPGGQSNELEASVSATSLAAPVTATGTSYDSTSGVLTLTFAANPWGTNPITVGATVSISGIVGTGGGVSQLNGSFPITSLAGTVIGVQAPAFLSATGLSGAVLASTVLATATLNPGSGFSAYLGNFEITTGPATRGAATWSAVNDAYTIVGMQTGSTPITRPWSVVANTVKELSRTFPGIYPRGPTSSSIVITGPVAPADVTVTVSAVGVIY